LIQQRVRFGAALDGPRLLAIGTVADQIASQVEQQVLPELAAHLGVGSFGDGVAVLAESIDAAFEADPCKQKGVKPEIGMPELMAGTNLRFDPFMVAA
jgi:hypothetical protein